MMQTDEIHESFYDLFNQHFRKIKVGTQEEEKKTHFFANVAIGSHSKPCRVNHNFQCLVVIKESELALTPAPFLNRFEKYRLSTACFLEASLNKLSLAPLLREAVEEAKNMTWLSKDCSGSRRSQVCIKVYFLKCLPLYFNPLSIRLDETFRKSIGRSKFLWFE